MDEVVKTENEIFLHLFRTRVADFVITTIIVSTNGEMVCFAIFGGWSAWEKGLKIFSTAVVSMQILRFDILGWNLIEIRNGLSWAQIQPKLETGGVQLCTTR